MNVSFVDSAGQAASAPAFLPSLPTLNTSSIDDSEAKVGAEAASQITAIWNFQIAIGAADAADFSFLAGNTPPVALGFGPGPLAFLKQLPIPTRPICLHPRSPAVIYYNGNELTGLDPSRQVPLTQYQPGGVGWRIVFDADRGEVDFKLHGGVNNDTKDKRVLWALEASWYLHELEKDLNNLYYIPLKHWGDDVNDFGFVAATDRIWPDVKDMLTLVYGWPQAFRRDDWVRDLPELVEGWKEEDARLEKEEEERRAEVDSEPSHLLRDYQKEYYCKRPSVYANRNDAEKHNRIVKWLDEVDEAHEAARIAVVDEWLENLQLDQ